MKPPSQSFFSPKHHDGVGITKQYKETTLSNGYKEGKVHRPKHPEFLIPPSQSYLTPELPSDGYEKSHQEKLNDMIWPKISGHI